MGADLPTNELVPGHPRLGWLIDGDPATPDVAVMLHDAGSRIMLTVPTMGLGRADAYQQWFQADLSFDGDNSNERSPRKTPRVLLFEDSAGTVALVGCRPVGATMGSIRGTGQIVADFAVFGASNLSFDKIHRLRTELPGLALWSGIRSIETTREVDTDGRMKSVTIKLNSPPPIRMHTDLNLALKPTWHTSQPDNIGSLAAHESVEMETATPVDLPWHSHFHDHLALRDLLIVAAWQKFGFKAIYAMRDDDEERSLSGDVLGAKWSTVSTHRVDSHEEWTRTPLFLFNLDDIGISGVHEWLRLRTHFARAIQPLVTLIDHPGITLETQLTQSGVALESLGYQLALDENNGLLNTRGQISFANSLDLILSKLAYNPIKDPTEWKLRSRRCYMSVKHPDNELPDTLTLANTLRENILVLRAWVSSRVGVNADTLKTNLAYDRNNVELRIYE